MAYTTVDKPTAHFNTKLWTGNGSAGTAQTGVGFQPDWVWIKARAGTQGGQSHVTFDAIRGAGKFLYPDDADGEVTDTNRLTSFDSDGFTVGSNNSVNASSTTYASWNWLGANGTASNTDGSVTTTVSVNTTAGFSIVSYTGTGSNATIGHGLGASPRLVITKNRSSANNWAMYHASTGNTKSLQLDNNNTPATSAAYWNNTTPTSSVFTVSTGNDVNKSGDNMIAYCFLEKKGYSKFGTYVGNGNSDGKFVHLGFKPAFFITRRINTSANWSMWDNTRGYNGDMKVLYPDIPDAENNGDYMDFVSNGVKLRDGNSKWGADGDTYIYIAFAENPFVTAGTKAAGLAR
tara:strand:- start:1560 stop:2600 length:1041 start_codon:yes stop_codon:yes gene_type:complete